MFKKISDMPYDKQTIEMLPEEKILNSVEVKKAKRGKGQLLITSFRIIFEVSQNNSRHIVILWNDLLSVSAEKEDMVIVMWKCGAQKISAKFTIDSLAQQFVSDTKEAYYQWEKTDKTQEIVTEQKIVQEYAEIKNAEYKTPHYSHIEEYKKQKEILAKTIEIKNKIKTISPNLTNKQTIPTEFTQTSQDIESKPYTPDKTWNDCYYDGKMEIYVIQNQKVISNHPENLQDFQNADLIMKNTNSKKSKTITKNQVEFVQEYPALSACDEEDSKYMVILPTITDQMLTKKLVLEKWYPKQKRTLVYYTESDSWIDHHGDKLCTKEYEILQDARKISQDISIEMMQQIHKVANS